MTTSSDTPDAFAARRARLLARQARVGILRNPNDPPRPPLRKAQLMGKWPSLQSARRTVARRPAETTGAASAGTTSDTELARLMKAGNPFPPDQSPEAQFPCGPCAPDTAVPAPPASHNPDQPASAPDYPAPILTPLVAFMGLAVVLVLTLLAAAS